MGVFPEPNLSQHSTVIIYETHTGTAVRRWPVSNAVGGTKGTHMATGRQIETLALKHQ